MDLGFYVGDIVSLRGSNKTMTIGGVYWNGVGSPLPPIKGTDQYKHYMATCYYFNDVEGKVIKDEIPLACLDK